MAKVTDDSIAEIDVMTTKASLEYLEKFAKEDTPFLMSINFAKNHQPNLPADGYKMKLPAKSKYADCFVDAGRRHRQDRGDDPGTRHR